MILHHFTAAHLLPKIRTEGLTRGALPWNYDAHGNPTLRRGFQWLTRSASFDQPWALLGNLPYARNTWRITVEIPRALEGRVFRWTELCRRCQPDSAEAINTGAAGDLELWHVYAGRIPPAWFVAVERNPGQAFRPEEMIVGG